jgi:hypothetical protein
VFGHFNGHFAFYLTLVPIVLMLGSLYAFKRQVEKNAMELVAPAQEVA